MRRTSLLLTGWLRLAVSMGIKLSWLAWIVSGSFSSKSNDQQLYIMALVGQKLNPKWNLAVTRLSLSWQESHSHPYLRLANLRKQTSTLSPFDFQLDPCQASRGNQNRHQRRSQCFPHRLRSPFNMDNRRVLEHFYHCVIQRISSRCERLLTMRRCGGSHQNCNQQWRGYNETRVTRWDLLRTKGWGAIDDVMWV